MLCYIKIKVLSRQNRASNVYSSALTHAAAPPPAPMLKPDPLCEKLNQALPSPPELLGLMLLEGFLPEEELLPEGPDKLATTPCLVPSDCR